MDMNVSLFAYMQVFVHFQYLLRGLFICEYSLPSI